MEQKQTVEEAAPLPVKNIFRNGRIYIGVTPASFGRADHWNTESEAEHNEAYEAYCNYIESFPSISVEEINTLVGAASLPTNSIPGWISVEQRLPTKYDACDEYYNEVLTIQVGRKRPTFMKFWEIQHCPFTKWWMKITPPEPTSDNETVVVIEDNKPLTQCMAGRDTECYHPKCPAIYEGGKCVKHCTLPLYDWRE